MAQTLDELLASLDACPEAREWAHGKTLAEAWAGCPRGDWMLWLAYRMAGEPGWAPHSRVLLAAAACAETALPPAAQSDAQRMAIEWMRWRAEGGCGAAEAGLAVATASDIAASDGAAAGAVARAADICRAMLPVAAAASE